MRTRFPQLLLVALLALAAACTESPDLVAVALRGTDAGSGGLGGGGGGGGGGADTTGPDSQTRCKEEALAGLRIPAEVVFASFTCSVSLAALQQDEDDRLTIISSLLAGTPRFEPDPSSSPIEQCVERGLWWIEGETVRLCQPLCDTLEEGITGVLQRACPD